MQENARARMVRTIARVRNVVAVWNSNATTRSIDSDAVVASSSLFLGKSARLEHEVTAAK